MKADINTDGSCLDKQAYMETVCYKCCLWGFCQAAILETCQIEDPQLPSGKGEEK